MTPRKLVAAVLLAAATLAPLQAVQAKGKLVVRSVRYHAPSPFAWNGATTQPDPTCRTGTCMIEPEGRINIGRARFEPIGGRGKPVNIKVTVKDDVDWLGQLALQVCENVDLDGSCFGERDRNRLEVCVKSGGSVLLRGVRRTSQILVHVKSVYSCTQYVNDIPDNQGAGTMGTVTIKYRLS